MRPPTLTPPVLIGAGLAILVTATWWSIAPVVTALGIISLGTTEITLSRFRNASQLLQTVILHATIYAALYALFVGATLHAASRSSAHGLSAWTALDLAISVLPMTLAAKRLFDALRQPASSKQ